MSSPAPGPEHHRVVDEVGWTDELQPEPPATEPLQEPIGRTAWRVLVSPRAAMVDLGRDVDAVRKAIIIIVAYALTAMLTRIAQSTLGYPPGTDAGTQVALIVFGLPLTLIGYVLAAYVLRLAIPDHLDRRMGTAFARLSISWTVPAFGLLLLGVVEVWLLAAGVVTPAGLADAYVESGTWTAMSVLLGVWPILVTAIAIRVATQRNWLVVVGLLIVTAIVSVMPTAPTLFIL